MAVSKLHEVLETGVQVGASDVHIREGSPVMLRVDKQLQEIADFVPSRDYLDQVLKEICTARDLAAYSEHGDADFAHYEDDVGRFRVNLHRQRSLIAMTLRHIKAKVPNLAQLGLPEVVLRIAEAERGIILVAGTTGSGKSTTMACMLEHMNENLSRHVITIEDPIEFHFVDKSSFFEQREVGMDTSSFDSALIHALRQDPDVIVVGEMRNRHSFDTALTAADTGHLVLSTLHTSNAPQSVQRILDFYQEEERNQVRQALATNLQAIICQRLIPRASGKGVAPALEIMINAPIVRKLLEENKLDKLHQAIAASSNDGMTTFDQCLLKMVNEGQITEEMALQKSTNREMLKMNLKGIFLSGNAILG